MATNCNNTGFLINGVELDIDPTTYEIASAEQSGSVHMILDKSILVQKIGGTRLGMKISGQTTNGTVVSMLVALIGTVQAFDVSDYDGNTYSVTITPASQGVKLSRMRGVNQGWEYALDLIVLASS